MACKIITGKTDSGITFTGFMCGPRPRKTCAYCSRLNTKLCDFKAEYL